MDCDTTGVEPDFALVKFKKLAGGGYFKIANQSLRPALVNLGYTPEQIHDILKYVMGTLTCTMRPARQLAQLKELGRGSPTPIWTRSKPPARPIRDQLRLQRLVARRRCVQAPQHRREPNGRRPASTCSETLGFTKKQIDEANDVICGRGTVEGAPHLKPSTTRLRLRQQMRQAPARASSTPTATSA